MSATPNDVGDDGLPLNSQSGACACPICSGQGLESLVSEAGSVGTSTGSSTAQTLSPLSALPQLSSRPGSLYTIHLDFNGHSTGTWGAYTNVTTPVYDTDGDRTTFSAAELAAITEIWQRVAEDYAPFNINVTTVDPGNITNGRTLKVAIGGNSSDWFGASAGGVAYINSFTNSIPNVVFVFSQNLAGGVARYVAEAASHEAGHAFGLLHQSSYSGTTKTAEYNQGTSAWAPIMGVGYYSQVTTWSNGANSNGSTSLQDDMAIIARTTNGFGYRADDRSNTTSGATALTRSGTSLSGSGVIERTSDLDYFSFTTSGGSVSFTVNVASVGANLDAILELRSATGTIVVSANPTNSLNATVTANLAAGTYYVDVRSTGVYGRVGQYTITGTAAVAATPAPEITVLVDGGSLTDDASSVNFGSAKVGTAITKTFTVKNDGNATLTLSSIVASSLPSGFSLVTNLGSRSLAAGASTTFSVRLNATAVGTFGGALTIISNDANEAAFTVQLAGTVTSNTASTATATIIDDGAAGFTTTGVWTKVARVGRESDITRAAKGTGSSTATWAFTNLQSGQYRVYVTYSTARTYATNAPFSILSDSTVLRTTAVNQRLAPTGTTVSGSKWRDIGTVSITNGSLSVRLTNLANGYVVADGVRIERIGVAAGVAAGMSFTWEGEARNADSGYRGANLASRVAQTTVADSTTTIVASASNSSGGEQAAATTEHTPVTDSGMNSLFASVGASNGVSALPIAASESSGDEAATDALFQSIEAQLDALDSLVDSLAHSWV